MKGKHENILEGTTIYIWHSVSTEPCRNNIEPIPFLSEILPSYFLCVFVIFFSFFSLSLSNPSQLVQVVSEQHLQTQMPPEMRSQDARRVDETTNLEQPQAYDQIQHKLNDTRADANIRFRELKEAMDVLVSRVDITLQKTQLSLGECSLPRAPQFPTTRDSPARFNWTNEGTPPQYHLRRPKGEFHL
jgi:hypothetical protein